MSSRILYLYFELQNNVLLLGSLVEFQVFLVMVLEFSVRILGVLIMDQRKHSTSDSTVIVIQF